MKVLALVLALTAGSALAGNGYDLTIDLTMNGKHVASPRVIVKDSEVATVSTTWNSQGRFLEVVATEFKGTGAPGILIKFTLGSVDKTGARTVLSRPQILTTEGPVSKIEVGNTGAEQVSLTVQAKRITF